MYGLKAEGPTNIVLVSVVLWDLLVIRKKLDSANLILQQTNAGKLTKIKLKTILLVFQPFNIVSMI